MIQQVNFSIDIMENGKWRIENEEQKMTTQASPASIKSRFACKAQPHDRFSEWKTESLARPQATAAMRRHSIRAAERHTKRPSFAGSFCTPTQRSWSATFGYRNVVSPEPYFVYRGLLKSPIGAGYASTTCTRISPAIS